MIRLDRGHFRDALEAFIIDRESIAIVGLLVGATSIVLGWIARAYFSRMDRDRKGLNALIEQSAKRNEEQFREINVQLEKMDRKIAEPHRETGGALLDLTYKVGRHEGTRACQGGFGGSVGAALLAPERRTVVGL